MVAITVLMLVASANDRMELGNREHSAAENIARLCVLRAQRIGCTLPHRLHVLISSLLAMAQDGLRRSPLGGTVYAHVRYLGEGAYAVSVQTQAQISASANPPQDLFSGIVMNLEDGEPEWTCRTDSLLGRIRGGNAGLKDTNRNGTGGLWRPGAPSPDLG